MSDSESEDDDHEPGDSAEDGETEAVVAPTAARRRAGPFAIALRVLIALVSAAVLVAAGRVWYSAQLLQKSVNSTDVLTNLNAGPSAPPADDGATDILLVGTDSRTDASGNPLPRSILKKLRTTATTGVNTDTIILLRVPKDGGKAYAISIPRDTYVSIPGIGKNKINSAYGLTEAATRKKLLAAGDTDARTIETEAKAAGRRALAGAVQSLTGIRVDHYAEINLYGFYLLSKAVGGVTVCLRQATKDKDSGANFAAGVQTISGSDAVSFVRQRKNLPGGDLARIERQQVFLASAAKKLLSAGTLTDPSRLAALADTAHKTLTMDPGLHLIDLLKQAHSLASGDVTFETIPVVTINGRSPTGQSIVEVDPNVVRKFVHGLVRGATANLTPTPTVKPSAFVVDAPARTDRQPTPPVTIDGHRCVY